jgi:hypothetical protein
MTDATSRGRNWGFVLIVFLAAMIGGALPAAISRFGNSASDAPNLQDGFFRAMQAHATATHSTEGLIMCTGELDNTQGLEGVYVLDVLTGEINGACMNPRTRKFSILYNYSNLMKDLNLAQVKNPKFVMVTGECDMPQGYRGARLGRSVIYVAELNTGVVGAYGVPFNAAKISANQPAAEYLVPLDSFKFRSKQVIRD